MQYFGAVNEVLQLQYHAVISPITLGISAIFKWRNGGRLCDFFLVNTASFYCISCIIIRVLLSLSHLIHFRWILIETMESWFFNVLAFHFSPMDIIVKHSLLSRLFVSINNVVFWRPSFVYRTTNNYMLRNTVVFSLSQSRSKKYICFLRGIVNRSTARRFFFTPKTLSLSSSGSYSLLLLLSILLSSSDA